MWAAAASGSSDAPALKDVFAADFMVGAAVGDRYLADAKYAAERALTARHFCVLTPENAMKWGPIHPRPGRYRFEKADALVAFAERHGMNVVGHTLVWHSRQTPAWVYRDAKGAPLGRDALLDRMRDHIHTVVGRYKGRVMAWDVVNEAVTNAGLRRSQWRAIIGDDFIEKAFEFAREADPDAQLFYNDYGTTHPGKRKQIVALVKRLKARGLRIDGVGMQGHWRLGSPALESVEATIEALAAAGVKVMITELDMTVLPWRKPGADVAMRGKMAPGLNPYVDGLPANVAARQAKRYADLFRLFLKHRKSITRVTFWGLHDGASWLNHWPIRGRTNHALLFDRACAPKPAFHAVVDLKR